MESPGTPESGMDVFSRDGKKLGRVKATLGDGRYVHVDCPRAPDYYVPVEEIAGVSDGAVHLRVTAASATNMGWEARPDTV